MKATSWIFLITLLCLFGSCRAESSNGHSNDTNSEFASAKNEVVDTVFYLSNKEDSILICTVKASDTCRGTIILLPGWNYSYKHWTDSCDFLETAVNRGFNVIMPEVHKTIYTNEIYAETRMDWKQEVTRDWMNSVFLPKIYEQFNIDKHPVFVAGVSTGGRGALFLAMENQELFKAGASISGDFDQNSFSNDNLYRGFFGSNSEFPERYKGIENPLTQLIGLKLPYYFGHAMDDAIVTVRHTQRVEEYLHTLNNNSKCEFHYSKSGEHRYSYWNDELIKVLDFFESL